MIKNPEKDLLLCYIVDCFGHIAIDKELFLPAAAHIVDGRIVDFMYDSFIFLSQPNYLYDYLPEGARLKPLNKADWLDYVTNEEFLPDMNINALDAAVGEAKKALGNTEYKANVFMTLFYPVKTVSEFGEVNGKNLDFSDPEDRKAGLKWMVDESLRQFAEKNYENIRLAGFYWFCEDMDFVDGGRELTRCTTDYIRSLGLKTCWCPYFYAQGYDKWQELGFDIAAHQANYFPEHRKDWPNRGTAERLPLVAESVKQYGIGVGMEMSDPRVESAEVFKQYMVAGAEYGFMNYPHIYYMGRGPKTINELCNSENPYLRSTYDELYKFIHRTLKPEDVHK